MYYVYDLVDPRDGSTFYIGKGKGDRMSSHELQAATGWNNCKCNRIRDIWKAGFKVTKRRIRFFETENEAYDFEDKLIEHIGLNNLTNMVPGGRGCASYRTKFKRLEPVPMPRLRRFRRKIFNG